MSEGIVEGSVAMYKCSFAAAFCGESVSEWLCFCISNHCVPPGCRGPELEIQGEYGNIGEKRKYCYVDLSYNSYSLFQSYRLENCDLCREHSHDLYFSF